MTVPELIEHTPGDAAEARDLERIRGFVQRHTSPFDRRIAEGHLTASALVLAADGAAVLLLHHVKLERWLQPGGHAEADESDGAQIALREAREETGIEKLWLHPEAPRPLDVDVHEIPARSEEPAHLHLDLRYLVLAPTGARIVRAEAEARDVRWFMWDELAALELDSGLMRALRKARALADLRGRASEPHDEA